MYTNDFQTASINMLHTRVTSGPWALHLNAPEIHFERSHERTRFWPDSSTRFFDLYKFQRFSEWLQNSAECPPADIRSKSPVQTVHETDAASFCVYSAGVCGVFAFRCCKLCGSWNWPIFFHVFLMSQHNITYKSMLWYLS